MVFAHVVNQMLVFVDMSALNIEAGPPQLVTAGRLSSEPVTCDRGTIGDGV